MHHPLQIIIADPFSLTRNAVKDLIRKKEDVFAPPLFAENIEQLFNCLDPGKCEWILLTDDFINHHDNDCISAILEKCKSVKILLLTAQKNIFMLCRWQRLGVKAFIHKSTTGDEIKKAVLHIKDQNSIYRCPVIAGIFEMQQELLKGNKKAILSEQQRNVFILRMQGMQNKEVADALNLTPDTARDYYKAAVEKIRRWKKGCYFLDYAVAFGII